MARLVTVALISAVFWPIEAHAKDKVIGVEGFVGGGVFVQGDSAPPVCCDERDDWSAPGLDLGVRLVIRYAKYGRITIGGLYGYYSTDEADTHPRGTTLSFHKYAVTVCGDLVVPLGDLEWRLGQSTVLSALDTSTSKKMKEKLGIGLRTGVDFPAGPLRLGVEAEAIIIFLAEQEYVFRAVAGW